MAMALLAVAPARPRAFARSSGIAPPLGAVPAGGESRRFAPSSSRASSLVVRAEYGERRYGGGRAGEGGRRRDDRDRDRGVYGGGGAGLRVNEFGDEYETSGERGARRPRAPPPRYHRDDDDDAPRGRHDDRHRYDDDRDFYRRSRRADDRGSARAFRGGGGGGGDDDDDRFVEEVLPCSGKEPGRVIGKGGATIDRIQNETGARIDVLRDEEECRITGGAASVAAALKAVKLVMARGDGPSDPSSGSAFRDEFGDDARYAAVEIIPCVGVGPGRVIGKRGATVMRIQDETGARIEVKAEDGQCFVSGTREQVDRATVAVRRIIEEGDGYEPVQRASRNFDYDGDWGDERLGGSRDRGEWIEEIIPCRSALAVGRVIGKRGTTVSRIESETGAKIQVDQRMLECVVSGYPEAVAAASRQVKQVMVEGFGGAVERVECTGMEGLIIGPGGARVRRIRTESKARVDVQKISEHASECVIKGDPDAVRIAVGMVTELMEEERRVNERRRGGGGWEREFINDREYDDRPPRPRRESWGEEIRREGGGDRGGRRFGEYGR